MNIRRDVALQDLHTFGIAVSASHFCEAGSLDELREALAYGRHHALPVLVLGGGSNVLFREDYPGLVIRMAMAGITAQEGAAGIEVQAQAGENWHAFVTHCLEQGWHGLENLALIPGSVGAAPIQNIGAYGVEVKDRITGVRVLNIETDEIQMLSGADCAFAYRDSVFKNDLRGKAIVLSVHFLLRRDPHVDIRYGTLATALEHTAAPTPRDVFEAVCRIRRDRLPDPAVLGNAGSFFKNPVIPQNHYLALRRRYLDMPSFTTGEKKYNGELNDVKIPAAWLIEQTGWKGRTVGRAAVYERQPLVLVNLGGAAAKEITALAFDVMAAVADKFGIRLEPEVQWIPALSAGGASSRQG